MNKNDSKVIVSVLISITATGHRTGKVSKEVERKQLYNATTTMRKYEQSKRIIIKQDLTLITSSRQNLNGEKKWNENNE